MDWKNLLSLLFVVSVVLFTVQGVEQVAAQVTRTASPSIAKSVAPSLAGCIVPTNGMVIQNSVVFCQGNYSLPDGVRLHGSNIVLDCNGSVLDGGTGQGFGIITSNYGWGGLPLPHYSPLAPSYVHKNIEVKNCHLKNYGTGVMVYLADGVRVHSNTVDLFIEGIVLIDSKRVQVVGNILDTGESAGIRFSNVRESQAIKNIVRNVVWGLSGEPPTCVGIGILFDGLIDKGNIVYGNDIDYNCMGVGIIPNSYYGSTPTYSVITANQVYKNKISNSSMYAVYSHTFGYGSGDGNSFVQNNIVNNMNDAYDVWNNSYSFNYWDKHICVDKNRDGVCDNSYNVPLNNVDASPSVKPN